MGRPAAITKNNLRVCSECKRDEEQTGFYPSVKYRCIACHVAYCRSRRGVLDALGRGGKERVRERTKNYRPYSYRVRFFEASMWLLHNRGWFHDHRDDMTPHDKVAQLIKSLHEDARHEMKTIGGITDGEVEAGAL